jgi:hypothetical protein
MNSSSCVRRGLRRLDYALLPGCSQLHSKYQRNARLRVTNEGREVRVQKLFEEAGYDEEGDYIVVDPENPVPNPELGPLERRVSVTFEEGLALETIDKEAMDYWFTEPVQGWQTGKRKLRKAQGVPVEDMFDDFRHPNNSGRKMLGDLRLGDVLSGTVVEHLLHHGLRVDVGSESDALIPMRGINLWKSVCSRGYLPEVGDKVEIVVTAVHNSDLFRFPLQAAPADEQFAALIPLPEDYKPPLDLRDVPISEYENVAKHTGREYSTQNVLVMPDDVDDRMPDNEDLDVTDEELKLFDSIVADL